jgi:hypothetical protein
LKGYVRGNFDAPVGMRLEKAEIGFGLALIGNEQYSPSFVFCSCARSSDSGRAERMLFRRPEAPR